ncbi:glycosyltransferase [Breznakiella homolactica]|uniref:Glycosyltransferase family 2 protein n=1 Tax=Breznakiella homolactica TaxID=2798577 RepID=A0A7T7XNC5_9SPIR|nr:glycosyltransferase family 2 protein [Breznakiella homolactica]QQO09458.1 glycosyltransferase family 2 protein [Breznakiella homolactica]
MKLLIAVPTYNEIENIKRFVITVFEHIPDYADILVIDDNSPDGTAAAVEDLIRNYPNRLHILNRESKQGLAAAYLAAFEWGLSRGYDVFLEMDADFSHNPKYIPEMIDKIETNDVVIGSRNISGGGVEGWSALRNFISKGGSLYSRLVLGCPIKDLTGGFNMWRKSALEKINLETISAKGYLFQIEMKYKAFLAGCSITEIPIIFTDRKQGKSKMSKGIFVEALINIWKIKSNARTDKGSFEFIKFAVTGGLGTVTNLVIFFIFADLLKLPEIPVSICCFIVAATQNYIINHHWSFRNRTESDKPSIKKWFLFIVSSLLGLGINILVMRAILTYFNVPLKLIAQAGGILAGMVINYAVSKFLVFRRKK